MLCFCSLCLRGRSAGSGDGEILIGEYGPLTGATATFGVSTRNGIDLAVDAVNRGGGVLGKRVRVVVEDDQGRAQEAQRVVAKLISQDNVIAVLGEVASSISLAAAPVSQQISGGRLHFSRLFHRSVHGFAMAKFAAGTLKGKNAAILRDINSDYSVGLADAFSESFKKMGGNVLLDETYSGGDTDFIAQLTKIKSANPDVIFVPGYYTEAGLIAIQAKRMGLAAPMLGADGWDSPKLVAVGGDSLNGSYYSHHYSVNDPSPENRISWRNIENAIARIRMLSQPWPSTRRTFYSTPSAALIRPIRPGSAMRLHRRKIFRESPDASLSTRTATPSTRQSFCRSRTGKSFMFETVSPSVTAAIDRLV